MSGPIASAASSRAPSPTHSEASSTSSSAQSTGLYVPVHKRGASVHSDTDASPTSSWRSVSPVKGPRNGSAKSGQKKARTKASPSPKKNASSADASPKRTSVHIPPASTMIPTITLPFVYPISALLALSHTPASLSEAQLERVRAVNSFIPVPTIPASADPAEKTQDKEKNATRRRRVGRARKNTLTQTKAVTKAVDVHARRAHRDHGHGTWGWNQTPAALAGHQHDMEESWRHHVQAPQVVEITAA